MTGSEDAKRRALAARGRDQPNECTDEPTQEIYRPYVAGLTPTPQQGVRPQAFRSTESFGLPLVVLVAWGADATQAGLALLDGQSYARIQKFSVRDSLTSYGGRMSRAPLVGIALTRFLRRDIKYERAWWLVQHSAISARDIEIARADLRQAWSKEAAQKGDFRAIGPSALTPAIDSRATSDALKLPPPARQ